MKGIKEQPGPFCRRRELVIAHDGQRLDTYDTGAFPLSFSLLNMSSRTSGGALSRLESRSPSPGTLPKHFHFDQAKEHGNAAALDDVAAKHCDKWFALLFCFRYVPCYIEKVFCLQNAGKDSLTDISFAAGQPGMQS